MVPQLFASWPAIHDITFQDLVFEHSRMQAIRFYNAKRVTIRASLFRGAQLCSTLSYPMDCSPPDSSVHGIFQARVLEWGAIAFSILKDVGSILGSGRSPGGGHGNPLQYSCLENPMDQGAWWAAVYGVAQSRTRLSDWPSPFPFHASEMFLPGESQGQRSLVGCRLWGHTESDTTEVTQQQQQQL